MFFLEYLTKYDFFSDFFMNFFSFDWTASIVHYVSIGYLGTCMVTVRVLTNKGTAKYWPFKH